MPGHLLLCGDVLEVLASCGDNEFDACFCDPPYGLEFMGKEWDHGVPGVGTWREVHRVLKPGAMLLAFGGTRTHHRLMCAIEDAGFEVRDCLMWLYGSGFPKSLSVSKVIDKAAGEVGGRGDYISPDHAAKRKPGNQRMHEGYQRPWRDNPEIEDRNARIYIPATDAAKLWDGYGTALKPAWEPAILAMKPCEGTFAENALKWGLAGLNVDGGRIGYESTQDPATNPLYRKQAGYRNVNASDDGSSSYSLKDGSGERNPNTLGRWPANLLLDEEAAAMLDEQVPSAGGGYGTENRAEGQGRYGKFSGATKGKVVGFGDSGGASRFFYTSKASVGEREAGLIGQLPCVKCGNLNTEYHLDDEGKEVPCRRNAHPTIKPLKLCEYFARLILPPARGDPRCLLVPFAGSGSEMIGALRAGWDHVFGIEISAEYVALAEARLREADRA